MNSMDTQNHGTLTLLYGRDSRALTLPSAAKATIFSKPHMPTLSDPAAAVGAALEQSINSAPLSELAAKSSRVCIAICDITRPVPNHLFLRPMIQTCLDAGIAKQDIVVLIATGLHRPNEGEEMAELIGDRWVMDNVRVENHFARDDAAHTNIGTTQTRGVVVRIDRRFVEADLRIATGLVEPHFMAGYSGGRKVIAPGLAHAETITTFHSARFMADPATRNCNFVNNPLHEEQLEIVKLLGGAYALNTVIDEQRNLSFVNFGEILSSHEHAVRHARQFCEVPAERKFHTVVTSAAGYPLDKTYYQTIKGMVGAMDILQPGGDLIIASECSEGMGSPEFVDAQRQLVQLGGSRFRDLILQQSHAQIDQWQTQMLLKPQAVGNVHLYSERLPAEDHPLTGVNIVDSLDAAVARSVERSPDKHVAIIPEGPYVVPYFAG